jgi:hypothetical protein
MFAQASAAFVIADWFEQLDIELENAAQLAQSAAVVRSALAPLHLAQYWLQMPVKFGEELELPHPVFVPAARPTTKRLPAISEMVLVEMRIDRSCLGREGPARYHKSGRPEHPVSWITLPARKTLRSSAA